MANQSAVITMLEGTIERLNREIAYAKEELAVSNRMVWTLIHQMENEGGN